MNLNLYYQLVSRWMINSEFLHAYIYRPENTAVSIFIYHPALRYNCCRYSLTELTTLVGEGEC